MKNQNQQLWLIASIVLLFLFPPLGLAMLLYVAHNNKTTHPGLYKLALAATACVILVIIFIFFFLDNAIHFA